MTGSRPTTARSRPASLRHERPRHHDRPVRQRPTTRRPAAARCPATTAAASTTSSRSRRRSATQLLHAVGIALAAKIRKTGQVAMTSMGEGSSNQGDVHEGAQLRGHPQAAVHVRRREQRLRHQRAGGDAGVRADVADRAPGYGIPGVVVDGADVLACYAAAREAVALARAGEGPTLIEAKVTRLTAHSSDDQQTKYRSAEELAAERGRDPLPLFREPAPRRRRADRRDRGATDGRDQGRGRRRDRVRRGAAGPRSRDRACATSTPRTARPAMHEDGR